MGRTDRVSLAMNAGPERVYEAFTDPAALETWLAPPGMECTVLVMDLRPGGELRMVMRYTDGSANPGKSTDDADIVVSRIVEVVPGERLVQSVEFEAAGSEFAGSMTMAWSVSATPDGSLVEFRADDVPPGISAEDHRVGMTASLRQLASYLG